MRAGGGKIRKRSPNVVGVKKSLLQVDRKWPEFCTVTSQHSKRAKINSSGDGNEKVTPEIKDDKNAAALNTFNVNVEKVLNSLCDRVSLIENEQKIQIETLNQMNRAAMQQIQKLRCEFEIKSSKDITSQKTIAKKSNETKIAKHDENGQNIFEELKWLKERMYELSDSMKLHSECLRKVKCDDFPKFRDSQDQISASMHNTKCQLLQNLESVKASKSNEMSELKSEIENLKYQTKRIASQAREIDTKLKSSTEEICVMRFEFIDKISEALSSADMKSEKSIKSSKKSKSPYEEEQNCEKLSRTPSDMSYQYYCTYPEIKSSFCDMKKQISSQSICVQQIVRDMGKKLERREFEIYRNEISDTIDTLMQLKYDIKNSQTVAGCSIPLSKNVNCISCQATANMTITTSAVPKLPALKPCHHQREANNNTNNPGNEQSVYTDGVSNSNWNCYNRNNGNRRVGENATKINQCMRISRMRQKRLKTPFKCGSPILLYKNRFRKNCYC